MNTQVKSFNRSAVAALTLVLLATGISPKAGAEDARTVPDLGRQIASQGNAALEKIRAEATQIQMPVLRAPEHTESAGTQGDELQAIRATARIALLRRGIYVNRASAHDAAYVAHR